VLPNVCKTTLNQHANKSHCDIDFLFFTSETDSETFLLLFRLQTASESSSKRKRKKKEEITQKREKERKKERRKQREAAYTLYSLSL
jgi:hypothetical protein